MRQSDFLLLKTEIETDIAELEALVEESKTIMHEIGSSEPGYRDKAALGAFLHSFYNGIESILKRIAEEVDNSVPVGERWHGILLQRMMQVVKGVRPCVLSKETVNVIEPYLGFRHFFRHSYTFQINWLKMEPLVKNVESVFEMFKNDIKEFLEKLKETISSS